jgi:hypothetical protein
MQELLSSQPQLAAIHREMVTPLRCNNSNVSCPVKTHLVSATHHLRNRGLAAAKYTGQSAQFTVSAEGDGFLSYQWGRSDVGIILGANSDTYTIPSVVSTQNGVYYYCDIGSTVGGAARSNRALLTAPVPQLSFILQPSVIF